MISSMLNLVVLQGGFCVGCHAVTQCHAKKTKYFYIGSSWGTFVLSVTSVAAWHVREILLYKKMNYLHYTQEWLNNWMFNIVVLQGSLLKCIDVAPWLRVAPDFQNISIEQPPERFFEIRSHKEPRSHTLNKRNIINNKK